MGLYIKQNGAIKPLAGSAPGEGLPVGAITAFTANSIPSGWLLCDGSTFDETLYPALFLALGGNVLPDLRNRFLEGADSVVREYKEAGLPNITGEGARFAGSTAVSPTGAFTKTGAAAQRGSGNNDMVGLNFDASLSNEIYGNSDTVQPASYTVNYIIKATSGITTEAALDTFNMIKEYERKQNILSDIETITLTETDTEMPYDGVIGVSWRAVNEGLADRQLLINGVIVGSETAATTEYTNSGSISYLVKKGDNVRVNNARLLYSVTARFYKERDYEGRA